MKTCALIVLSLIALVGCNTDNANCVTLMPGTRYLAHAGVPKPNPTNEQICLLKARKPKIKTQHTIAVAHYEAQKVQKVKVLELEQTRSTNTVKRQITVAKTQAVISIEKERQSDHHRGILIHIRVKYS